MHKVLYIRFGICPSSFFSEDKLKEIQSSDFDFVFIDTPPYLSNKLTELCDLADVIIIPTKAGVLDLLAIKSTIDIIEHSGNEKKLLLSLIWLSQIQP
jgi:chromosome partitioning protein